MYITGLAKVQSVKTNLTRFTYFVTQRINRFWNMNPHVGLALKRQFPYVGNVLSALEKLFLLGSKKQSVFFRLLTKQFDFLMTEVCLLGKAYILHYYINHFSGDEFLRITILSSRPPTLTLRDQNPWQLFWPLCCPSSITDSDYLFGIFQLFLLDSERGDTKILKEKNA